MTTTADVPQVRHPFLHGLGGGAASTLTAVLFGGFAMSIPVFVVTLVVTGVAVLVARPLTFARACGILVGVSAVLAVAVAGIAAWAVNAGL
ncbi:MAG TPA: hypothetical protein VGX28_02625 [Frankiaceae bacterium]|jgi:hypothetical protein|nr:hypothetical protein [Frankiaceae bacterium]